jgi:hypothetical protein
MSTFALWHYCTCFVVSADRTAVPVLLRALPRTTVPLSLRALPRTAVPGLLRALPLNVGFSYTACGNRRLSNLRGLPLSRICRSRWPQQWKQTHSNRTNSSSLDTGRFTLISDVTIPYQCHPFSAPDVWMVPFKMHATLCVGHCTDGTDKSQINENRP